MDNIQDIKNILKVTEFNRFEFGGPEKDPNLAQWEVGRLVNTIEKNTLTNIAEFRDDLTPAQISNIQSDNHGDSWSESFELVWRWCRKNQNNNRQVRETFVA